MPESCSALVQLPACTEAELMHATTTSKRSAIRRNAWAYPRSSKECVTPAIWCAGMASKLRGIRRTPSACA
jgi:hypothetical protein